MTNYGEVMRPAGLKLERAEHHINDLNGRIDAFLAERPFKLMVHYRSKTNQIALRTKTEKPIPPEFSLIVGDAAHNLRAALDLALYPMAKDRTAKPDRIQFPFTGSDRPDALESAMKRGQVEFAGKKVVEAIRLLKPYPAGNLQLYGVHALDIIDKHRLLILSRSIPVFMTGTADEKLLKRFVNLSENPEKGIRIAVVNPEGDDLLTANYSFATRGLRNSIQEAEPQPAFQISFGDEHPLAHQLVTETLVKCAHEVRRAVTAMVEAFFNPDNTIP